MFDEKPFERQKAGIPDPKAVSYYHNSTFQSVCHHYGAKAGDTIFQEAFARYKDQESTDRQVPVRSKISIFSGTNRFWSVDP